MGFTISTMQNVFGAYAYRRTTGFWEKKKIVGAQILDILQLVLL